MCREGTSFSSSGKRMQTSLETEVFSLARSFTLSKRYLVSDFSSSLWYAVFVYSIIEAAVRGEPDAVRMALRCYSGYIAVLSKRTIRDKRGFSLSLIHIFSLLGGGIENVTGRVLTGAMDAYNAVSYTHLKTADR